MTRRTASPSWKLLTLLQCSLALAITVVLSACSNGESPSTTSVSPVSTTLEFEDYISEIPVPFDGGTGLPDFDTQADGEIDCEEAESLCEFGEVICDDVADFCDYGPDGGELPDEFDWDN